MEKQDLLSQELFVFVQALKSSKQAELQDFLAKVVGFEFCAKQKKYEAGIVEYYANSSFDIIYRDKKVSVIKKLIVKQEDELKTLSFVYYKNGNYFFTSQKFEINEKFNRGTFCNDDGIMKTSYEFKFKDKKIKDFKLKNRECFWDASREK